MRDDFESSDFTNGKRYLGVARSDGGRHHAARLVVQIVHGFTRSGGRRKLRKYHRQQRIGIVDDAAAVGLPRWMPVASHE